MNPRRPAPGGAAITEKRMSKGSRRRPEDSAKIAARWPFKKPKRLRSPR